jgi:hypothetical protein
MLRWTLLAGFRPYPGIWITSVVIFNHRAPDRETAIGNMA